MVIAIRAMVDRLVLPQGDLAVVRVDAKTEHDIATAVLAYHIVAEGMQGNSSACSGTQPRLDTFLDIEGEITLALILAVRTTVDYQAIERVPIHLGITDHRSANHRVPPMSELIGGRGLPRLTFGRSPPAFRLIHHDCSSIGQLKLGNLWAVIIKAEDRGFTIGQGNTVGYDYPVAVAINAGHFVLQRNYPFYFALLATKKQ